MPPAPTERELTRPTSRGAKIPDHPTARTVESEQAGPLEHLPPTRVPDAGEAPTEDDRVPRRRDGQHGAVEDLGCDGRRIGAHDHVVPALGREVACAGAVMHPIPSTRPRTVAIRLRIETSQGDSVRVPGVVQRHERM